MPIVFRIDSAASTVRVTVRGRVTPDEVLQYRRDLVADPAFRKGMNLLIDASDVDTSAITKPALEAIAEDLGTMGVAFGPVRMAIVVGTPAAYGLARMYEVLTEGAPLLVRAFRDESEAAEWIRAAKPAV